MILTLFSSGTGSVHRWIPLGPIEHVHGTYVGHLVFDLGQTGPRWSEIEKRDEQKDVTTSNGTFGRRSSLLMNDLYKRVPGYS